jgi:hypothetical protein
MSRTLVHYSATPLGPLKNVPYSQVKMFGKPSGFWYAYEDAWAAHIASGTVRRFTKSNISNRYTFDVSEEAFVDDVSLATIDSILQLNSKNWDTFMQRFHKSEFIATSTDILHQAFRSLFMDGESIVISYLAEFREELQEMLDAENLVENNIDDIIARFDLTSITIPADILQADGIRPYAWPAFWKSVREVIGGVEFAEELFTIKQWGSISVPWLQDIEIRSGVIFRPSLFRSGVHPRLQSGGTRRRMRHKNRRGTRRR